VPITYLSSPDNLKIEEDTHALLADIFLHWQDNSVYYLGIPEVLSDIKQICAPGLAMSSI
jgi:hypothetical protein